MRLICQFKNLKTTADGGVVFSFEADISQYKEAAGLPLTLGTNIVLDVNKEGSAKQKESIDGMG